MIKKTAFILTILLFLLTLSSQAVAQQKPKMIKLKLLEKLIEKTDGVLLMKVEDRNIIALNQDRVALYPADYTVGKDEVFFVYDVKELKELIKKVRKAYKTKKDKKNKEEIIDDPGDDYVPLPFDSIPSCPPRCS